MIETIAPTYKVFKDHDFYEKKVELELLPFNFAKFKQKFLLTNMTGDFIFVDREELIKIINKDFNKDTDFDLSLRNKLLEKDFIFYQDDDFSIERNAIKYRTKKRFMFNGPSLHLFVVTIRCQHKCHYCQITPQNENAIQYDMTPEVSHKAVEFMMNTPSENITVEFQGGEPLLAFHVIKDIILYTELLNQEKKKNITYVIATTLVDITDEQLLFLKEYDVELSTSLDGDEYLHNQNRPIKSRNTYQSFIKGLQKARKYYDKGHISPLTTLSKESLKNIHTIVDSYLDLGYHSVYLRPLSPFGFAVKTFSKIGYSIDEYIEFYLNSLDYIIQLNKQGIYFKEGYAVLLLKRILTPYSTGFVDLQSPSGAAISAIAYYYNGDIFPADEARMLMEMGDDTFKLGNLQNDTYQDVYSLPAIKRLIEDSTIESVTECQECVYQQYCGSTPLFNYAEQGDHYGHRPTSDFCKKQKQIFEYLLNYFYENDTDVIKIFWSWIQNDPTINPYIASNEKDLEC